MSSQTISKPTRGSDVFGGIIEASRREGFDEGYQRAARDLLASLVFNAEEFLHDHPNRPQELRKVLYSFVARLEGQIDRNAERRGFFEGGLGI
jgi:hypothetical protein